MPASRKINKDDIIKVCLEIVRKDGINGVNARRVAKELNCSTQPIFYLYKNMDEIKNDLYKEISNVYFNYILNDSNTYKDTGLKYIKFAKDEPNFFKILFNGDNGSLDFVDYNKSNSKVYEIISMQTGLSIENAKLFNFRMWFYVNGIANLVANKTCDFSDDELNELLREQYISMILYEYNRGNIKKKIVDKVIKDGLKRKDK